MPKPQTIDRHRCHGKDKEEKYKDLTALDYWWGLRELAADFDVANYETVDGSELTPRHEQEIAYIQLLHYTVEVKLAGAYYQIESLRKIFETGVHENFSLDLRVLEAKEAFDAVHSDLYQPVCSIANQLFLMLNRNQFTPTKFDRTKPIAMSPSDLRYWMKINRHPDLKRISNLFNECEAALDIRHHATHYGAVPVYANPTTGIISIQENFQVGDILTKYDLGRFIKKGGKMIDLVEASTPRVKKLCSKINDIYAYIYTSDMFEQFLKDRGLKIKESYAPYWEQPETSP
ncbi:MAG: hypothetical protein RRA35_07705 [Desulfomonilia bacterium]|nr:hypothetical protein [Desulfomonilia bacterium]